MNRVADLNDSVLFCMGAEAVKPAYMRKKVSQGCNTDYDNALDVPDVYLQASKGGH